MTLTFLCSPDCIHIFDATVETFSMFASTSSLGFGESYTYIKRIIKTYYYKSFLTLTKL